MYRRVSRGGVYRRVRGRVYRTPVPMLVRGEGWGWGASCVVWALRLGSLGLRNAGRGGDGWML